MTRPLDNWWSRRQCADVRKCRNLSTIRARTLRRETLKLVTRLVGLTRRRPAHDTTDSARTTWSGVGHLDG